MRRQQGIAIVEFAVSVPIFIVILMVSAEIGRAYYSYNTLTKSVRSGARYMSLNAVDGGGDIDVDAYSGEMKSIMMYGDLQAGTPVLANYASSHIDVVESSPSGGASPYVTVTATYPYVPIYSQVPKFFSAGEYDYAFTMNASATMRVLK